MFEDFGLSARILFGFAFYYPLFMAYHWMIGALYYFLPYEIRTGNANVPPRLPMAPSATFLVPCHNDQSIIEETVVQLMQQNYPDFEVIAINDCSKDGTGRILDQLARRYPRLRVIHLAANQGKATALTASALLTRNEYLICIDSDALLDKNAAYWMMWHFLSSARVGAVTGNLRIRNRSTLLGRVQVGEFSSTAGLLKRAQRTYGRLFTLCGAICAFRKSALHHAGYWSPDMLTEDIDITWKLEIAKWDVRFEPGALCWILMPETLDNVLTMALWSSYVYLLLPVATLLAWYIGFNAVYEEMVMRRGWESLIDLLFFLASSSWSWDASRWDGHRSTGRAFAAIATAAVCGCETSICRSNTSSRWIPRNFPFGRMRGAWWYLTTNPMPASFGSKRREKNAGVTARGIKIKQLG